MSVPPDASSNPGANSRRSYEALLDEELWARCVEGERLAWETLVQRYQRLVYAVPVRAGLRSEEVEEVFQSTFARLAERVATIRDPSRIRAWVVTTARRLTIDVIRERKKHPRFLGPAPDLENLPDESPAPDEWFSSLERRQLLRVALGRLEDRCQRIIRLLFYDESDPPRSYESIAAELGMPLGSLGPTRSRCLKKLLEEFQSLEGGI